MHKPPPQSLVDFYQNNAHLPHKIYPRRDLRTVADVKALSALPWLRILMELPHKEMLEEAQRLYPAFMQHRNTTSEGWGSLCIHGISSAHTHSFRYYGYAKESNVPYGWTDICKLCPRTYEFFHDTFAFKEYKRLRFMSLAPGGYVLPHTDFPENRLSAINIALNQPADCDFVMEGDGTVPFREGDALFVSTFRPHIVWNRSKQPRFHIIVHGAADPAKWDKLATDSYDAAVPA